MPHHDAAVLAGQLIVGGFESPQLPKAYRVALEEGRRAGAILFRRNIETLSDTSSLCAEIARTAPGGSPPIIAVDQEGGRVARLPAPLMRLPAMRDVARLGPAFCGRVGKELGRQLLEVGFSLDFAPVLDVDSNPKNPIIGDRSFGNDPHVSAACAIAFGEGLQESVAACGKHFPGHGDTDTDSHLELPMLDHDRARFDRVELVPFRKAASRLASMMSAHIVCPQLEPGMPATLSQSIIEGILRTELAFEGVIFSDDLEMQAIAGHFGIEEASIAAIRAGCDLLLICSDLARQDAAHRALVHEIDRDSAFAELCQRAADRGFAMRRRFAPRKDLQSRAIDHSVFESDECRAITGALSQGAN